jgi:hypothetical protein
LPLLQQQGVFAHGVGAMSRSLSSSDWLSAEAVQLAQHEAAGGVSRSQAQRLQAIVPPDAEENADKTEGEATSPSRLRAHKPTCLALKS